MINFHVWQVGFCYYAKIDCMTWHMIAQTLICVQLSDLCFLAPAPLATICGFPVGIYQTAHTYKPKIK